MISKSKWRDVVAFGLLLTIGVIFAYAGAMKWREPRLLADSIAAYRIPLGRATSALAILLPPIELLAAAALLDRRTRRAGLLVIGGLTVVFLLALGQAALRGFQVDCGCFGTEAPSVSGMIRAILRDLFILMATLWLLRRDFIDRMEGRSGVNSV